MDEAYINRLSRIEEQFKYTIIILLTTSFIGLYISFSMYESKKPVHEINKLIKIVGLAKSRNGEVVLMTRPEAAQSYFASLRERLDDSIKSQLKYNVEWGIYDIRTSIIKDFNFILVDSAHFNGEMRLGTILDSLSNDFKVLNFSNFECKANRQFDSPSNFIEYYNVTNLSSLISPNVNYIDIRILVGRSNDNLVSISEEFYIKCYCNVDTVILKQARQADWIKKEFPWIYKNLNDVEHLQLQSFNRSWQTKMVDEVLNEEQIFLGLKIRNRNFTIILVLFFIGLFLFHLSILKELAQLNSRLTFSFAVFFRNKWALILRWLIWVIIPQLALLMCSYYLSDNWVILFLMLPLFILGILVVTRINTVLKSNAD